jgi:hypothetical protein
MMDLNAIAYLSPSEQEIALDKPALAPPGNLVSNLDNPPSGDDLAFAVVTTCAVLSSVGLILRVYARFFVVRSFAVEDCKSPVAVIPIIYTRNIGIVTSRAYLR